jgi:predicted RNase H-like nuclease (RuvC/YqgF family)
MFNKKYKQKIATLETQLDAQIRENYSLSDKLDESQAQVHFLKDKISKMEMLPKKKIIIKKLTKTNAKKAN